MQRIFIVCEGESEETFVKHILAPYFYSLGLYLTPFKLSTSKGHKGGALNYDRVKPFITKLLKSDKEAFVSTFFDYYALPDSFPKYHEQREDIYEKIKILEQGFSENINENMNKEFNPKRFFPHIQPHEFESLLFSDIESIIKADAEWDKQRSLIKLEKIIQEFQNPELINNSHETSPSHRLKKLFPTYKKVLHGNIIVKKITIQTMRAKCPHFDEWCKQISALAQQN